MPTVKRAISSRVTVKNPRPRKYASAAEKQAAFRARFPTLCVRVEPKTADTVQAVADASGRTQQETLLSMLKYAMTNRNWLTLGLTDHKQLPRIEEPRKANPMKRKPTPAQIAARERFAAMAKSGAFKKKAAKARKKNPMVISKQADASLSKQGSRGYVRQLLDRFSDDGHVVSVKKTRSGSIGIALDGGRMLTVASARKKLEDYYGITDTMKRRSNPRASNPQTRTVKHTGARNIAYAVQAKRMLPGGTSQFETVAGFPTKAQAQDYIDALLKNYPKGLTLRISAA